MRTFHPMFRKGLALVGLVPLTRASAQTPATQESALQVQRFTVEDGLAQNQVQAVAQDRRGFMWVGTRRGLQRFDGYSFVNYSTLDPAAPNALASLI